MNSALVTGGSGAIGGAICTQLAKDHALHVIVNYFSSGEAADRVVKEIIDNGGSAEAMKFDVRDPEAVNAALKKWHEENPENKITVLVNCAGIIRDGLFVFTQQKDWSDILDTKLKGFYNVTRNIVERMLLARSGRIINISSLSGILGTPGQVNYSAANAGLIAATKSLAMEVARRNITVNTVAPGYIESRMTEGLDMDEIKKRVPAKRLGKPGEVAAVVSFLASPGASYINGEVIPVTGGITS